MHNDKEKAAELGSLVHVRDTSSPELAGHVFSTMNINIDTVEMCQRSVYSS